MNIIDNLINQQKSRTHTAALFAQAAVASITDSTEE